jgi:glycosidase
LNLSSVPPQLHQANLYEVNLRQYSEKGDIAGFMKHLPRLASMGVDILWLMPIHPIGEVNRKGSLGSYYSVKDFCGLNPDYGTKDDFRKLVETAHALGMRVIIDWVANHAAWDNVWTTDHPEYFTRDETGRFMSPYDWSDVIQIDHRSESEQVAMADAMEYWVRHFDIDGFRADLAHLTPLAFWKKARRQVDAVKPGLVWLAETEEPAYHEVFDISYAWKWMHKTADLVQHSLPVQELRHLLMQEWDGFPEQALKMYFTSNHDENSWNGTEYEKYGIYAKALAVFSFAYSRSVPLIYSGQELPNRKRLSFFEKDVIGWTDQPALGSFYSTLLHYRKTSFSAGTTRFITFDQHVLAFEKTGDSRKEYVFLNFDKQMVQIGHWFGDANALYVDVFTGTETALSGHVTFQMEPGEFLLLQEKI